MRRYIISLIAAFGLISCVNTDTQQLSQNEFIVSVDTTSWAISGAELDAKLLEGAAKLTLEKGYDYFEVINQTGSNSSRTYSTPVQTYNPYSGFQTTQMVNTKNKREKVLRIKTYRGPMPQANCTCYRAAEIIEFAGAE